MNNKTFIKISVIVALLFSSQISKANSVKMGLSIGPAIGVDTDFNKEHQTNALHFKIGLDALYPINCPRGGFCKDLFLQTDFTYLMGAKYSFGSTQIKQTGVTGNFSETITYYGGSLGFRKQFFENSKIQPFTGLGTGFEMIKISNLSFTDALGTPLALNTKKSAYNLSISPTLGISYKLSHKLAIEFMAKAHLLIPSLLNNSYFEFPLGIKYSF